MLGELGPWLGEVNPILDWVDQHQATLTDMFANLGVVDRGEDDVARHPARPATTCASSARSAPRRSASARHAWARNRGNAYFNPLGVRATPKGAQFGILPSFDCNNTSTGGEVPAGTGVPPGPACHVQAPYRRQEVPARHVAPVRRLARVPVGPAGPASLPRRE